MTRWEERTTIAAPAGDVFAYVSDFEKHGEWSGHGLTVTKTTDGPVGPGTVFATVAKQFGTQRETSTVKEVDPGSRFVWESKGGLGLVRHWFDVTSAVGATTLSKGAEFVTPSFLAKVMMWRTKKDLPASLRKDLENIKATMEQRAGA